MLAQVKVISGFCGALLLAGLAQAETLTFSEINLNWFGKTATEARAPTIRKFLRDQGLMADVMVFEEIVNLPLLERGVLDNSYDCHSYERADAMHQHVVMCNKTKYKLEAVEGAGGFALETVDVTGHLRPAVHGILTTADGRHLAHVFGVHLKAMPNFSTVRLQQIGKIASYLSAGPAREPVILLGDFNTFANDPADIDRALAPLGIQQLALPEPFTWASATENFPPAKFDRVWVSRELAAHVTTAKVVGPCSSGDQGVIGTYNNAVSDHCAVSLAVDIAAP